MNERIRQAFETLEVDPGADEKDVKRAYRDLAQVWHPDRFSHNERLQTKASVKFTEVTCAYDEVLAWLKDRPSAAPPPRPPPPRPPPAGPSTPQPDPQASRRNRARALVEQEKQRRLSVDLGPWDDLELEHAPIRGPGGGLVIVLSQARPLPVVKAAFAQGLWVTSVAAGPNETWLTVLSRWGEVQEQKVCQAPSAAKRMEFVLQKYSEDYNLTAFASAEDGWSLTAMTKGTRSGTEHYQKFGAWPAGHPREMRSKHDEALTLVVGSARHWHLVTTQVDAWGGQRVSTRTDWAGLGEAIKIGWDEGRRITSVGWSRGAYAVVTTMDSGIGTQTYGHCKDLGALTKRLAEQWSERRVVTSVCHDEDGWVLVFSEDPTLG